MAFSVHIQTIEGKNSYYDWYILGGKPELKSGTVIQLYADSTELKHITDNFKNVPICIKQCIWRVEMAAFIFENL